MSKKIQKPVSKKTKATMDQKIIKKKPTSEELKKVTQKTISRYRQAIKNLAKR